MINIQKGKKLRIHSMSLSLSLSLKKVRTSAWTESFRNFKDLRLFVILSQPLLFFVLRRIFCLCPSVVLSRYPVRVSLFCSHVDICGVFVREKCVCFFPVLPVCVLHPCSWSLPSPVLYNIFTRSVLSPSTFFFFSRILLAGAIFS